MTDGTQQQWNEMNRKMNAVYTEIMGTELGSSGGILFTMKKQQAQIELLDQRLDKWEKTVEDRIDKLEIQQNNRMDKSDKKLDTILKIAIGILIGLLIGVGSISIKEIIKFFVK